MKKFTIGFSIFLAAALTAMLVYVAAAPDFVLPAKEGRTRLSEDNPIWDKSLDDLVAYLDGKGVFPDDEKFLLIDGIATEAILYSNVELYWWDLDNLSEDDILWENYQSAVENGYADIKGIGELSLDVQGPFAIGYYADFTGDPDALMDAFHNFCVEFEEDSE